VVLIGQRPATTDRHKAWISDLRQDHEDIVLAHGQGPVATSGDRQEPLTAARADVVEGQERANLTAASMPGPSGGFEETTLLSHGLGSGT
jgi:hypothetical protein